MGARTTMRCWIVGVAVAAAACGPIDDARIAPDVERGLERGRAYAAELAVRSMASPDTVEAVAAGYLERLRLGLGSPFRLIEHALLDPRLEPETRRELSWALLQGTLYGESYRIDPGALGERDMEVAARHIALIEGAIRGSADPDGGMLAVRLAYSMAAAESTVSGSFRDRVMRVSALVRDRVQSQHDAVRLLRAAGSHTDPFTLLTTWRQERYFDVERAAVHAPAADIERDAIARAPRLLESIREIRQRPRAGPVVPRSEPLQRPVLGPAAALILADAAAEFNAPPQTPVALAVRAYGRVVGDPDEPTARFFESAVNEERLAAEYTLLAHRNGLGAPARLALVAAAVGLRAYAQERPWFPGFGGPTSRDLEDRYGLGSIVFPNAVPSHWRPYYRRMLESSLTDLRRVLPSLDLRGLKVRFEPRAGSPGTLAVHDPRTRTMYIPTVTGAGTIAHEVAHDIDWQTALRRYRVRGDYGSDRAVRLSEDQLTQALRGLTAASLSERTGQVTEHDARPAEVFARSMDWFVAVALARDGRMNGYLSSVQDDVLTGYGTVRPPDVTGGAGQALVALLDEVAPVYPETRRWFIGSYGRARAPTAQDLTRRVVEARLDDPSAEWSPMQEVGPDAEPDPLDPVMDPELDPALDPVPGPGADPDVDPSVSDSAAAGALSSLANRPRPAQLSLAMARLDRLEATRDNVLAMVDGACRAVSYDNAAMVARRRLVGMVTEARARGVALEAAAALGGTDAREWLAARLEGRNREPAPDEFMVELLDTLVERVETIGGGSFATAGFDERPVAAADCGALPFLTD